MAASSVLHLIFIFSDDDDDWSFPLMVNPSMSMTRDLVNFILSVNSMMLVEASLSSSALNNSSSSLTLMVEEEASDSSLANKYRSSVSF